MAAVAATGLLAVALRLVRTGPAETTTTTSARPAQRRNNRGSKGKGKGKGRRQSVIGRCTSGPINPELLALDIGGTLAKLVHLQLDGQPDNFMTERNNHKIGETGERYPRLRFHCPQTRMMAQAMQLIKKTQILDPLTGGQIHSAGGGAFKFADIVETELGIQFNKVDELEALICGFRFMLGNAACKKEVFSLENTNLREGNRLKRVLQTDRRKVSMLKVNADGTFERVGGTSMGGATFWGLCRLITSAQTFEEAMELCAQGKSSRVDKLVKDIYGGDYEKFNLKGSVVAASFGKLASMPDPKGCGESDLALALLIMITQQIALIAFNIAKRHNMEQHIFFVGGFLRFNPIARRTLAFAAEYQGTSALFLEHADFLGAIGALLSGHGKSLY